MRVVIIGGNERMACQYANICKCYGCKAKVFTKESGSLKKKDGLPRPFDFIYQYGFSQDGRQRVPGGETE